MSEPCCVRDYHVYNAINMGGTVGDELACDSEPNNVCAVAVIINYLIII